MFFETLKQLLWKDFLLRKRQKVLFFMEFLVPIVIFLFLYVKRGNFKNIKIQECHYSVRSLPSGGNFPFLQNLICNTNIRCFTKEIAGQYDTKKFGEDIVTLYEHESYHERRKRKAPISNHTSDCYESEEFYQIQNLVTDIQRLSDIISKINYDADYERGRIKISNVIKNRDGFRNKMVEKNVKISPEAVHSLLSAELVTYHLSMDHLKYFQESNVSTILCNVSIMSYLLPDHNDSFYQEMCNISKNDMKNMIDSIKAEIDSDKLIEIISYFDSFAYKIISLENWHLVIRLLRNIGSHSLMMYNSNHKHKLRDEVHREVGALFFQSVARLFCQNSGQFVVLHNLRELYSNGEFLCNSSNCLPKTVNSKTVNKKKGRQAPTEPTEKTDPTVEPTEKTDPTVETTEKTDPTVEPITTEKTKPTKGTTIPSTSKTIIPPIPDVNVEENKFKKKYKHNELVMEFWHKYKPFMMGKIIYSPRTTLTDNIMRKFNSSFDWVRGMLEICYPLQKSHKLRKHMEKRDLFEHENIKEFLKTELGKEAFKTWSVKNEHVKSDFNKIEDLLNGFLMLRHSVEEGICGSIDFAIDFLRTFDYNKLLGVDSEEDGVKYAVQYNSTGHFLALVVFDNIEEGDRVLPKVVKYKIRMSHDIVHSTSISFPFMFSPYPEFHAYFFENGFIYVQDIVERSIIEQVTGLKDDKEEKLPGFVFQMLPDPCHIDNEFLTEMFFDIPLYMVLCWMFVCAITVKRIVDDRHVDLKILLATAGVNDFVQCLAWFINCLIPLLILDIILTFILKFGSVFEFTPVYVLFAVLVVYSISVIGLSFLIAVFFKSSRVAAPCAALIFFFLFLPYLVSNTIYGVDMSNVLKFFFYLNPNLAFTSAILYLITFELFETMGVKETFKYLATKMSFNDRWDLFQVMLYLLIDAAIFMCLALYKEAVFPGKWKTGRPWYSPFKFKKQSKIESSKKDDEESSRLSILSYRRNTVVDHDFQHRSADEIPSVVIKHLTKKYGQKFALQDIDINLYEDEILAVIGQPGSGKTTFMSILTGVSELTSGSVNIYDMSLKYNMDEIRKIMGVCFQRTIVIGLLTVYENLKFLNALKGEKNSEDDINEIITDMNILSDRDNQTKDIPFSSRRKLALGMAFIGNSRFVVLDSPTRDVDPYNRRIMWNFIVKQNKGRTIILTTLDMFEADIADQMAIIAYGQLKYYGSSKFLTNRFDSGYYLHLTLNVQIINEKGYSRQVLLSEIDKTITNVISAAVFIDIFEELLIYNLPDRKNIPGIKALIRTLDAKLSDLCISRYVFKCTSLQEVFVKVCQEFDVGVKAAEQGGSKSTMNEKYEMPPNFEPEKVNMIKQFFALCFKSFQRSKRRKKVFLLPIIIPPIIMIIVCLLIMQIQKVERDVILTTSLYENRIELFYSVDGPNGEVFVDSMLELGLGPLCTGFIKDSKDCLHTAEIKEGFSNLLFDGDCHCKDAKYFCTDDDKKPPRIKLISHEEIYNLTGSNLEGWLMKTLLASHDHRLGGFSFGYKFSMDDINVETFRKNLIEKQEVSPDDLIHRENYIKIWFNTKAPDSPVVLLNGINNVVLRSLLSNKRDADEYGIVVSNYPLDISVRTDEFMHNTIKVPMVMVQILFIILALGVIVSSVATFVVEYFNSAYADHILDQLHGLNRFIFWLKIFLSDFVKYIITIFLCAIVLNLFRVETLTDLSTTFSSFVLLLILFGWATIPLTYLLSFMFSKRGAAFITILSIHFCTGVLVTLTPYFLTESALLELGLVTKFMLFMIPHYCLADGLICLEIYYYAQKMKENFGDPHARNYIRNFNSSKIRTKRSLFDMDIIRDEVNDSMKLVTIITLVLHGVLFFFVIFCVESSFVKKIKCHKRKRFSSPDPFEDNEVAVERDHVISKEVIAGKQNIIVNNITKVYRGLSRRKNAISHISFVVEKGECFGILGLKGSGKSTITMILAGLLEPTYGEVRILGMNPKKELNKIRRNIGYCPNNLKLCEDLTPREYLKYFSVLKSIPKNVSKQHINFCLIKFGLDQCADIVLSKTHKGTVQKVLLSIAFLGNPSIIILDDPTNEMEPLLRRIVLSHIHALRQQGHIIILSSITMGECETVCTRFAVLDYGCLRYIGQPSILMNKFGLGYILRIRSITPFDYSLIKLKRFMRRRVPELQLIEETRIYLLYTFPITEIHDAFHTIHTALYRQYYNIREYFISYATLTDAFMKFTYERYAEHGQAKVDDEQREPISLKKQLLPGLIGSCTLCLCFDVLVSDENDSEEVYGKGDDTSDQSSSTDDRGGMACWKKLKKMSKAD